jgi:hypothetical protein
MLAGVDLSSDAIQREALKRQQGAARFRLKKPIGRTSFRWLSDLTQGIDLSGCDLTGSRFDGGKAWRANFTGATLKRVSFVNCDLGDSLFATSRLSAVNLRGATAVRCDFSQAQIVTDVHLEQCNLAGASFVGAAVTGNLYLAGALLSGTRLSRNQVEGFVGEENDNDYANAVTAYAALKTNFRGQGLFEDASWAYLKERQMETKSLAPWRVKTEGNHVTRVGQRLKRTLRWAGSCLVGVVAGYGERPLRALGWVPVLVGLYATFYRATGSIAHTERPRHVAGWLGCFEHSLASFVTMNISSLAPRGTVGQFATNVEALTGVSLVALVMFALGRRITRS